MLVSSTIHLAKTMSSSPAENAIITVGEVADYLKVAEQMIYRLPWASGVDRSMNAMTSLVIICTLKLRLRVKVGPSMKYLD